MNENNTQKRRYYLWVDLQINSIQKKLSDWTQRKAKGMQELKKKCSQPNTNREHIWSLGHRRRGKITGKRYQLSSTSTTNQTGLEELTVNCEEGIRTIKYDTRPEVHTRIGKILLGIEECKPQHIAEKGDGTSKENKMNDLIVTKETQ